jgi:hypothetical protein
MFDQTVIKATTPSTYNDFGRFVNVTSVRYPARDCSACSPDVKYVLAVLKYRNQIGQTPTEGSMVVILDYATGVVTKSYYLTVAAPELRNI